MKRVVIYLLAAITAILVPVERSDVGKLIPVELVFLYREENTFVVETDTGNLGTGQTVRQAVKNLHETAEGEIFLDTADYLLIEETVEDQLEEIGGYLKRSARVCLADKGLDLAQTAMYLQVHTPKQSIKVAEMNGIEEKIEQYDGRIKIS